MFRTAGASSSVVLGLSRSKAPADGPCPEVRSYLVFRGLDVSCRELVLRFGGVAGGLLHCV